MTFEFFVPSNPRKFLISAARSVVIATVAAMATLSAADAQQVRSNTTLQISPTPHTAGTHISLRATVTGIGALPDGSVTFQSDQGEVGTAELLSVPANSSSIATGFWGTCVVLPMGQAQCFGFNGYGQNNIVNTPGQIVALAAGSFHNCALNSAGEVYCVGANDLGQLGDGSRIDRTYVRPVQGIDRPVVAIASRYNHTCALTDIGTAYCWGFNSSMQLGNGSTTDSPTAVPVAGDNRFTQIATGSNHTCGVTTRQEAMCWGYSFYGATGTGRSGSTPEPVSNLPRRATGITAGSEHSCATLDNGALYCWGRNTYGQLGDGTFSNSSAPRFVRNIGRGASTLTAGWSNTCATTARGLAYCWGDFWALGNGSEIESAVPVRVSGISASRGASAISLGNDHACALMANGSVSCWGDNFIGSSWTGADYTLRPLALPGGRFALPRDTAYAVLPDAALARGWRQIRAEYGGSDAVEASQSAQRRYRVR